MYRSPLDPTAADPPDTNPARRAFLGTACTVGGLLALGLPLSACFTPREGSIVPNAPSPDDTSAETGIAITTTAMTITLGRPDTRILDTDGGALVVATAGAVVVNDAGTLRAFSVICPHTGCDIDRIEPAPAGSGREGPEIVCPCHDARFGFDGAVLQGPARKPLTPLSVTRTQTGAVVTLG